jgi:hypothetical protein
LVTCIGEPSAFIRAGSHVHACTAASASGTSSGGPLALTFTIAPELVTVYVTITLPSTPIAFARALSIPRRLHFGGS